MSDLADEIWGRKFEVIDSYTKAKSKILEFQTTKPKSLRNFFYNTMKKELGIGIVSLENLAQKDKKGTRMSEMADDIWGKKFEALKTFKQAKNRILKFQPKRPSNAHDFFAKALINKLGIGLAALKTLAKKARKGTKSIEMANEIWGKEIETFPEAKAAILKIQPKKPKGAYSFLTSDVKAKMGIGFKTLQRFAKKAGIGTKASEMAKAIWG